ncbi:MAG: TetR/AcrR family transcriptional regulator [Hyphomicrobiales bacterium]|nr:TetR/AcrR family transcriptional regulator [Hyphomicrobiales bacterium]
MRKSADIRRREIIDAVLRLAMEVGPDRLTTQAVADAVGITQPAVFRHFVNRETLWVEVANAVAARMRAAWDAAEAEATSPTVAIRRLIAAQAGLVAAEPSILAILFSHELRVGNPALAAVFRDLMAELTQRLAACFAAHRDRSEVAAGDRALLVLGLVQSSALRWALTGRGFDLVGETLRLLDIQLEGLIATEDAAP